MERPRRHVVDSAAHPGRRPHGTSEDAGGDDPSRRVVDEVDRFALAAIDRAFVASRSDPTIERAQILDPLPVALAATRPRRREP